MTTVNYRATMAAGASFTLETPDARVEKLKKERGAVRYQGDVLPELPYTRIDDPTKITEKVVESAQSQFLMMIQKVFEALVEENLAYSSQWPVPLQRLYEESERKGNIDAFFLRGHEQQPPMMLDGTRDTIHMEYVPVFMEWLYTENESIRVMLNPGKSQFFILHLVYQQDADGRCYMGGAPATMRAFYGFNIDDLSVASRLRTVLAAFTPVEHDDEGQLTEQYRALHNSFTQWSLCH